MGVLMWDKPKKAMSSADWSSLSADGAPPGVYVPNMSDEDRHRWKAKLVGQATGFPQVEIRKDSTVIVLSLRGYKYRHYDTRQTPEAIANERANKHCSDLLAPNDWATIHFASAGPMMLSTRGLEEMQQAIAEGLARLKEIEIDR